MSFDTHVGTRGGRQPRAGLVLRLINKNAASRFRRTGKMLGFSGLILTTVGARSGAERASPVGWWPGPDGSWLIVAAANGAARNPAWYHNIAAHPDQVQIEVDGRRIRVTAEQLHGAERAEAWGAGGRSLPPRPASRNTSARPTASCRSSALYRHRAEEPSTKHDRFRPAPCYITTSQQWRINHDYSTRG
jgi:deazaflavin-dependent oxidoreductase (nitroreductase family)